MNPTKGVLEAIDVARATRSRLLIAAKMSDQEIKAVADYVAGLR